MRKLPGGNETILVVDDDDEIRASVSRVLERLGYRVHQAAEPDEALDLVRRHRIALLVGDVILPVMSGLTLAHRISSIRPDVRVLYMSGFTTEEALGDQSLPRGTVDFIQKPFAVDALARKVRILLDRPPAKAETGAGGAAAAGSSAAAGGGGSAGENGTSAAGHEPSTTGNGAPAAEDEALTGDESVLVVDDDPDVRRSISRMLERFGYRVYAAGASDDALQVALSEEVDLLVSDVILPRLNGLALAHTISSLRPRMKALYISGYDREELMGLDEGAVLTEPGVAFVQKPFTPEELGRAARKILDGSAVRA